MAFDIALFEDTVYHAQLAARRVADSMEQGGSCNLDACALFLGKVTHKEREAAEQVLRDAGWRHVSRRSSGMWRGYYILIPQTGKQGEPRMRAAEVMTDVFREQGFNAQVYYQLD